MSSSRTRSTDYLSAVPLSSLTEGDQHLQNEAIASGARRTPSATRRARSPAPGSDLNTNIDPARHHGRFSEPPPLPLTPSESIEKVSWMSLPHKSQLAILTLARLSEPITQTSLQSYLYHQIASFEPDAPRANIATHIGFVIAAFPAAQAFTSVVWGLMADSPRLGRKRVLVIGLLGTAVGSVGYGLSLSWQTAMFWRAFSGVLNGNVGVMRTMISEIVREKKYQSRAFLLMPMCFNIGTVIGPTLGGWLADPVQAYPDIFGPGTILGGAEGVWWMQKWPYALPNFVSALFLFSAAGWVIFGLDETLDARRDKPDWGRSSWQTLSRFLSRFWSRHNYHYSQLQASIPDTSIDTIMLDEPSKTKPKKHMSTFKKLPLRSMWTHNVLVNLLSRFLMALTVGTFQTLWFTFLSAPRSDSQALLPDSHAEHSFFRFSGGLGLAPAQVGLAMAILGVLGITLQLTSYPSISAKLGTTRSFRLPLPLFPLICTIIPFLARLPSKSPAPAAMDGPIFWVALCIILGIYVVARTFVLPASAILVNNCSPHPSRLGSLHGIAQSIGAGARFIGPVIGGTVFGAGDAMGMVGLAWWVLAGVGCVSCAVGLFVREGSGHEILLPGEKRMPDGEVVECTSELDEETRRDERGERGGRDENVPATTRL